MSRISLFFKRHRKGSIVLLVFALVLAGVGGFFAIQRKAAQSNAKPETNVTVLDQRDLDQVITTKGVVQSTQKKTVYTHLNYKVSEIAVDIGDTVGVGDFLARLDTRDVEKSIMELQDNIKTASTQQNTLIGQAQKKVTDARNQKTIDATDRLKAVADAEKALEDANMDVRIAAEDVADGVAEAAILADYEVVNARSVLTAAQSAMNAKKTEIVSQDGKYEAEIDLKKAEIASKEAEITAKEAEIAAVPPGDPTTDLLLELAALNAALTTLQGELSTLEAALATRNSDYAQLVEAYERALSAYEDTYDDVEDDIYDDKWIEAYKDAHDARAETIDAADAAYEQAVLTYNNTLRSNELAIQDRSNALTNQRLTDSTASLENQLTTAQLNIEDSTITSPFAGTVTEVIAALGARPSGPLFVIQDTRSLEITTDVAEYDIPLIHEGQQVRFTTEATGSDEMTGTVRMISPTAIDEDGDFEVTVTINTPDERLRIGMNAKLTIVLESRPAVFSVPYDAITVNSTGDTVIIGLREDGMTRYEIPVEVGMETDYFVEISGSELAEGLTILNDPEGKNVVTTSGPTSPFGG